MKSRLNQSKNFCLRSVLCPNLIQSIIFLIDRAYSRSYCRGKLISNKSDYFNRENLSIIDRIYLVVEQNVCEFSVVERYDIKRLFSKYKYALVEWISKVR